MHCCAGAVRRSSTDRPVRLRFDQSGTVVVCQSAGKVLEVFRWARWMLSFYKPAAQQLQGQGCEMLPKQRHVCYLL